MLNILQEKTSKPKKKIMLYIPEELYKELRVNLIITGQTVTGWFNEQVKQYLVGKSRKK